MSDETLKFDARLKEGVAYFEEMLKVMPDDRTTLEFLAVVYPQLGEAEKAERALAALARVLLKEGDLEGAAALLPRLEACDRPEAKAMALKVRAASAPKPDLSPEVPKPADGAAFAAAVAREAALAEELGEASVAEQLRALAPAERPYLVSALATLAKDRPGDGEAALARLADTYGLAPVPLDAFAPGDKRVREARGQRGVIPFARLGEWALVALLSPHDADLRRRVGEALGMKVRFYLADPSAVEAAVERLHPADTKA